MDVAGGRPGAPDREAVEQGRSAPAHVLADLLPAAPAAFLEGAVDNPALDEELALALLRNRGATEKVLRQLHARPELRRTYAVRCAIVRHPNAPRAVAMGLVHHLYWRDLARTADDYRVPPPVRRTAVKLLESRLEDLALGEQITLARTAGRSVLLALRRTRLEPVARAMLDNPGLTEDDLIFLVARPDTPADILGLVARSRRWMRRYPVRTALLHNPRTPLGVALGLLSGLLRRDLEAIAWNRDRPRLLRLAAARVLRERGLDPRAAPRPGDQDAYTLHVADGEE